MNGAQSDEARLRAGRHSHDEATPSGYPEVHYYAHPGAESPREPAEPATAPEPDALPGQFPSAEFGTPFGLPPAPRHRPFGQPRTANPTTTSPSTTQPQYDQAQYDPTAI